MNQEGEECLAELSKQVKEKRLAELLQRLIFKTEATYMHIKLKVDPCISYYDVIFVHSPEPSVEILCAQVIVHGEATRISKRVALDDTFDYESYEEKFQIIKKVLPPKAPLPDDAKKIYSLRKVICDSEQIETLFKQPINFTKIAELLSVVQEHADSHSYCMIISKIGKMIENDAQEETKEETKQDLKSSIVNQLMATEQHGFTVKIDVMKALPSFFEILKPTPNYEKVLQDIVGVQ